MTTMDKLIKLANGDVELVHRAIQDAVRPGENKADLDRVVTNIVAANAKRADPAARAPHQKERER